jgi:hypothetical protein
MHFSMGTCKNPKIQPDRGKTTHQDKELSIKNVVGNMSRCKAAVRNHVAKFRKHHNLKL